MYQPQQLLYEGKAKKIFSIKDYEDLLWIEYKDSLTAFNAVKKGSFEGKGKVNNLISNLIYSYLEKNKIPTHYIDSPTDDVLVCKRLSMIPLEVVVRNRVAGSLEKRFGLVHGSQLNSSLVEFYYKKDELSDPFISDAQIINFEIESLESLNQLKSYALKINQLLMDLFRSVGISLVDFKIEFGRLPDGRIILGDEISPDCCRLWDSETNFIFDKDRFRKDLGGVKESYEEVLTRLKEKLEV